MPLTVVIDYLKDDVSQNVETVFNMIKIMEKHKEESVETINSKLYEMQLAAEGDLDEQNMSKFLNK